MVDWVKTEKEIDKRIAERCVTHHHACDCREYACRQRIEALEAEVQRLIKIEAAAIEFVRDSYRPTPKYDAMRFDKLAALLPGGE